MNENKDFKPYIPAEKVTPESTVTSVIVGVLLDVYKRQPPSFSYYKATKENQVSYEEKVSLSTNPSLPVAYASF